MTTADSSTREPFDITTLLPDDTPEYMLPTWLGCISYAISQERILEQFRQETGNRWKPASTVFGRMIDEACGIDKDFICEFVLWVNVNLWGPIDGPKAS